MVTPPQNEAYSKPTGPRITANNNPLATLLNGKEEEAWFNMRCPLV